MYGRIPGLFHQYTVEVSKNGKDWEMLVDKSQSKIDAPNDYTELEEPVKARYIRYNNIHVPTPYLSISDFRIFGKGQGKEPKKVKDFEVQRQEDRRNATITWDEQEKAQGYNVLWGIAPDKLYSSWLLYGENELVLRALTTDQTYYFAVEAFNENGVSERTKPVKVE